MFGSVRPICRRSVVKLSIVKMSKYSVDLSAMRQPYKADEEALLEKDLPSNDPIELFKAWFEEAKASDKILESNAVCLTTCTKDGIPSSRMVLLKYFGSDGFKIFTNMNSRKGRELIENPKAALLFYWDPFNRQVRIEGNVELLPEEESKKYFESRPKRSQLAAAISNQSEPISSRDELISRYNDLENKHANDTFVPKPPHWGGIKLLPKIFEFWQGQNSRLHDRIIFQSDKDPLPQGSVPAKASEGWVMYRLQP